MATKSDEIRARLGMESNRIQKELNHLNSSALIDVFRDESQTHNRDEDATESLEMEKRLTMVNGLNGLLAEVTRALIKLDEGTYGYCDICKAVINPARMEALPMAILCLSCREKVKNAKTQSFLN